MATTDDSSRIKGLQCRSQTPGQVSTSDSNADNNRRGELIHQEGIRIKEISAKTILVKSNLPETDRVVNPYVGCQFACAYCYASFMGRLVGESVIQWGKYVYPKINAVAVFEKELYRLLAKEKYPTIFLSSVTDPYQTLEKKYRLTRGILELLSHNRYPGRISILTKSPLVLRDIDLFRQLPLCEVGVTVTTDDDPLGRELEVHAPSAKARLETLKRLATKGIETYAFIGPILPYYVQWPERLKHLIERLAAVGVRSVYVEHLNPSAYITHRIEHEMKKSTPNSPALLSQQAISARNKLEELLLPLLEHHNIRLRLGHIIVHS